MTTTSSTLTVTLDREGNRVIQPVALGPTWVRQDDGKWLMPEFSLGYEAIDWAEEHLLGPDGSPWAFTNEQARFVVWWYAINEHGRFLFQEGVLQRLKGWGKDPLLAVICAIELVGPCRFGGWDMHGEPIAQENTQAWVQVAAVSKDQTRNTMQVMQSLFTKSAIAKYHIRLGIEMTKAHQGQRVLQAVTSSPESLEGGRASFVVKNETHHWKANNNGHAMDDVISRNLAKSAMGAARAIAITNAYDPSEDSVAQRTREAYDAQQGGTTLFSGLLYDSLEAPPDAPLAPDTATTPGAESVLRGVRGDAVWLDIPRMVTQIVDPRNAPSQSRRFWFNQIVAAEDAWLDPAWVDKTADSDIVVLPGEEIVIFGDGSKSDDSTGLVGCRLSDGHVFTLGVWQKPPGERGKGWLAPRPDVDKCVRDAFEQYNIAAFFFDPSHTKDDTDSSTYWVPLIDAWHRDFNNRLRFWAVGSGNERHSIMWDMASPNRQSVFVGAAEQFVEDLEAGALTHDGNGALKLHFKNARRYPTRYGISLSKRNRESAAKIDLAVCAVGARLVRRVVLNRGMEEVKTAAKSPGRVWGVM